jgi:hypothetical protein
MFTKLKASKSKRYLKEGEEPEGRERDRGEEPPSQHSIIRDALLYDSQFSEKVIIILFQYKIKLKQIK